MTARTARPLTVEPRAVAENLARHRWQSRRAGSRWHFPISMLGMAESATPTRGSTPSIFSSTMRDETLRVRKLCLDRLLKRASEGILYNDHHGADGVEPRLQGGSVATSDQGEKSTFPRP